MANILLSSVEGINASHPVGAVLPLDQTLPLDYNTQGLRFLRSGTVETDASKFDPTVFMAHTIVQEGSSTISANPSPPVSMATNGSTLVTILQNGNTYYSTNNGSSWTQAAAVSGMTTGTFSTFVNGLFFVGGYGSNLGRLYSSSDGINWTERDVSGVSSVTINGITHGLGTYVVWASDANLKVSTDLVNWTNVSIPAAMPAGGVAFGNGAFVAVITGNAYIRSTNGTTWSSLNFPTGGPLTDTPSNSVAFGNGIFLAVGNGAVARSTDGLSWTYASAYVSAGGWASATGLSYVKFHGGTFTFSPGSVVTTMYRTSDGITIERMYGSVQFRTSSLLVTASDATSFTAVAGNDESNAVGYNLKFKRYAGLRQHSADSSFPGTVNYMRIS